MFLSKLRLWNFRKYGSLDEMEAKLSADLEVCFTDGLNLIVGENDSGKSTIIDAIKIILGTQSYDNIKIEENDFFKKDDKRVSTLKIECIFTDLSDMESGKFLEWLEFDTENKPFLTIRLVAKKRDNKIIIRKTAGKEGVDVSFEASENLRVTYLKPLRDAENELSSGYRSRFAQVLKNHPIFRCNGDEPHDLEKMMKSTNEQIEKYFVTDEAQEGLEDPGHIIKFINGTLDDFMGIEKENYDVKINISNMELSKILSRLMLSIDDDKVGLGTLNQLYIAMELLLLEVKNNNNEFSLALIEEIEAHIHPQAQLRVIKHLENIENSQIILTTHSITLASVVNLKNLIICREGKSFSLSSEYTRLEEGDYEFLERFLDSTKANLFFAKGIIMVEGDAENILIPVIAELIGLPLYKYGISVVNVGNVAFLRYRNIFISKDGKETIGIPISIVTDLDVRPPEYYTDSDEPSKSKQIYTVYELKNFDKRYINEDECKQNLRSKLGKTRITEKLHSEHINVVNDYVKYKEVRLEEKQKKYDFNEIKVFTNTWTMEYDLALSCIKEYIYAAVLIAKDVKSSEEIINELKLDNYIEKAKKEIEEKSSCTPQEIAYYIYQPLLKGNASKAVTAQYLAKILLSEKIKKVELVELIKFDPYIKYLVEAIKHVTER